MVGVGVPGNLRHEHPAAEVHEHLPAATDADAGDLVQMRSGHCQRSRVRTRRSPRIGLGLAALITGPGAPPGRAVCWEGKRR
jgi:hypothetical protein